MKKINHKKVLLITFVLVVIVNIFAWLAPIVSSKTGIFNWCDVYARYINPIWVNIWARIMNIFPFSVGEWLIVAGIIFVFATVIISIVYGVYLLAGRMLKKDFGKIIRFIRKYYVFAAYVAVIVMIVMTLNCTIYYHCSDLDVKGDFDAETGDRSYTIEELQILRNYIVSNCNELSRQMTRDENGYITYDGDISGAVKSALHNISDEYPRLKGYYPDVKHMFFSDLMSQSYMSGYYFPFSMEANCNGNMYIMNYPAVYAHELTHLHGYIYEDEANFLAYKACISSDDLYIKYSGYLSVLAYVNNAYFESIGENLTLYVSQEMILDQVIDDDIFLTEEAWEQVEDDALMDTETVDKASEVFTDTSLKLNGVEEGMASYSGVVELLLKYYEGILYN